MHLFVITTSEQVHELGKAATVTEVERPSGDGPPARLAGISG